MAAKSFNTVLCHPFWHPDLDKTVVSLSRVAPACPVQQAPSLRKRCSVRESRQQRTSPSLGSEIPRNPELMILYVCFKMSRRTGARATMEFPVCAGEPALPDCRGRPAPRGPAAGPTPGAGERGRCAAGGPGGAGGAGAGPPEPRPAAGPRSPGAARGRGAGRLATNNGGHVERARGGETWAAGGRPRLTGPAASPAG